MVKFIASVGLGLAKIGKLFTKDKKVDPAPVTDVAGEIAIEDTTYAHAYSLKLEAAKQSIDADADMTPRIKRLFGAVPQQHDTSLLYGVPMIGDHGSFESYLGRATATSIPVPPAIPAVPVVPVPGRRRSRRRSQLASASDIDATERSLKAERRKKTTLTPLAVNKYAPKVRSHLAHEVA